MISPAFSVPATEYKARSDPGDSSTDTMAETCGTTRGAGNNRAYEDAVNTRINGDLQEVESDLPEDIRDRALSVFRAAISDKATVQQAIEKVQKEALVEVETRFKGQRFKVRKLLTRGKCNISFSQGFIKFDYDTSVITINVNKFGNGNAQFSVGLGVKKMVCPDPFMGRLSDPNMNRK